MGKIALIVGRELKSKLTNKTFIIMTLLAPLLSVGFIGMIIYLSTSEKTDQKVLVLDESHAFENALQPNDYITFHYTGKNLDEAIKLLVDKEYTCLLYVPRNIVGGGAGKAILRYKKSPGFGFQTYLKSQMERILYEESLRSNNINPDVIHNAKQTVDIKLKKVDDKGFEKDDSNFAMVGFFSGLLMFVFILMYGMMVFRSVMEEKTNRIVEVIISSVKPIELMFGKIIGVALLGLIQFVTMGLITLILSSLLSLFFLKDLNKNLDTYLQQNQMVTKHGTNVDFSKMQDFSDQQEALDLMAKVRKINFAQVFIYFLLYFIGGYLFYSSLMAAIGSAVDTEADSQQFMLPVMLPLIAGYILAAKSIASPDSQAIFWGSMIPFTSPIVMMTRITGGVPAWEIAVSLLLLYSSFVLVTWLAGRIYRTGILMYGKKTSWREIGKWLFYKN